MGIIPIREYNCSGRKCDGQVERIEKGQVPSKPPRCPKCNSVMIRALSVTAPPAFKGSGFYATDYKKVGW